VEISPECSLSKVYSSYNTFIKNSDLEKYITEGINLMSCGTGLQSMFILSLLQTYSDMNKCSDSILLIEEPEVYLHPEYQRKMFHALRGIAADNQVIYTTHSPIMIGELWAKDSVRLITLDKGQADVVEIDVELVISELGIKYEDVLNPRVVIFVEGKEDEIFFKHVLSKKYSGKKESILSKIKFIQTDGYRNIDGYAYLKILRADNVTAQFCAIADSDGVESDQRKTNVVDNIKQYVENKMEVSELQKLVYILKGYSIETYLLDSTILNNAFPEISKDNIDELVKVYFEKYEAGIKEVNEGKRELSQFQRYYKPKLIFTRDAQKNPTYYKHYLKNYDDDKNFKETREAISNRCRGVEKSGTSYVEYILSKNDTKIAAFSEPVAIIDSIVDQFFNNK
jgi:uncharacterized protein YeeX (DUF496 family)